MRIILLINIFCLGLCSDIIIMALGSNKDDILYDRVKTAVDFAINQKEYFNITWYLSGGVKSKYYNVKSEAEKMMEVINYYKYLSRDLKWSIEIDKISTNTAENFLNFKNWIEKKNYKPYIYIVTSKFHKIRAEKILKEIIPEISFNWLLGNLEYPNCNQDEEFHSKNINEDVKNAIRHFYKIQKDL